MSEASDDRLADKAFSPVKLAGFATEAAAVAVQLVLEEHGVPATVIGSYTAAFLAEAPGTAHVVVRACDQQRAAAVLRSLFEESADVDWSQVDVGTPEGD